MIDFSKVYRIRPLTQDKFLRVYWLLGNNCTYKCSYCPSFLHDGSVPYISTDIIKQVCDKLPHANIIFGGGEPTYHPQFSEIIQYRQDTLKYSVISNGARPLPFWERISNNLWTVILTYHVEYANLERFTTLAKYIYGDCGKWGHVNLTMLPSKWAQCVAVFEHLQSNNIKVSPKPLLEDFGSKMANTIHSEYTPQQLEWIESHNTDSVVVGLYNEHDRLLHAIAPSRLLATGNTNFKGWSCNVGKSFILINLDGSVYNSQCGQRQFLGNIYDEWNLTGDTMTCQQDYCWSQSDIIAEKTR